MVPSATVTGTKKMKTKTIKLGPFLVLPSNEYWVQLFFGLQVRFASFICGIKVPKKILFLIGDDPRSKFLFIWSPLHTENFGRVVGVCCLLVPLVFGNSRLSKISYSVVPRVAVDMVYLGGWIHPVYVEPRQSVRLVLDVVDTDDSSSLTAISSSPRTSESSLDAIAPIKLSSFGFVPEPLPQFFCRNLTFYNYCSHDDSSLIGLVRARAVLVTLHGLAYFMGMQP